MTDQEMIKHFLESNEVIYIEKGTSDILSNLDACPSWQVKKEPYVPLYSLRGKMI